MSERTTEETDLPALIYSRFKSGMTGSDQAGFKARLETSEFGWRQLGAADNLARFVSRYCLEVAHFPAWITEETGDVLIVDTDCQSMSYQRLRIGGRERGARKRPDRRRHPRW